MSGESKSGGLILTINGVYGTGELDQSFPCRGRLCSIFYVLFLSVELMPELDGGGGQGKLQRMEHTSIR